MDDYESTRQRHRAHALARLPEHVERLTWSWAEVHRWRTSRLRDLAAFARRRSAWHRARLAGTDVERLDEERLRDLPPMTKDDLMANFDAIVTDPRVTLAAADAHVAGLTSDAYFLDDLHVVASGGSSGVRGVFVWDWDGWADTFLVSLRHQIHDAAVRGASQPPVLMVVAADNASHFTSANPQTFRSDFPEVHRLPVTLPLREIVDGLNRINGTHLVSYASMLGILAAEARAGRLSIRPQRLMSTAEPLLPEIRAAVRDAWQAPVANLWGTSEGGIMALGCFQSDGMHLTEDLVIIEPVDARGAPVPAGGRAAKVYLTTLCNRVLPLIRYELTDEVTMLAEPCSCGSAYRRVADIQGRLDDAFRYAGDVTIHPHLFRTVLGRHPGIVEYQVRQTATGAEVRLRAGAEGVSTSDVARQLEAELARAGLREARITAAAVDGFPRRGTGKLKRFVPL